MIGSGYLWKGLADSYTGYRDQQFKKELANQGQGFDLGKLGIQNASNERVAGMQTAHLGRANDIGMANYYLDHAAQMSALAEKVVPPYTKATPAHLKRIADLNARAEQDLGRADAVFGTKGYKYTPPVKETAKDRLMNALKGVK